MSTLKKIHLDKACLFALVLFGISLSLIFFGWTNKAIAKKCFIDYAFYFVLVVFIWWVVDLGAFFKKEKSKIKQESKRICISLLVGFLLSSLVFLSCKITFKINSDETNLLSVSRSLALDRKPYNVLDGENIYGNFYPIKASAAIPKRPLMFPFLTSIFHSFFGYSFIFPFVLNFLVLMISLSLYVFYFSYCSNYILGLSAALLFISNPVVSITSTSAGFDMTSMLFFMFSIVTVFLFIKDDHYFSLLLSTLAVFSNIRYESILLAFAMLCFAFFRKRVWPTSSQWLYASLFSLLMIVPYFWQITLSMGNYENPEGSSVFSLIHFTKHLPIFIKSWLNLSFNLPYASIITLAGLASTFAVFYLAIKKKVSIKNEIIVPICIALGLFVFLSHHGGTAVSPAQARFFIPFSLFCTTALLFYIVKTRKHISSYLVLFFSFILFILYHPIATEGKFMNTLTLRRELNVVYNYLKEKEKDKNILILHKRPGQFTVLGYGTLHYEDAKSNWKILTEKLKNRLFQKILVIEKRRYKDLKDTWLSTRPNMKEVKVSEIDTEYYVRILELTHTEMSSTVKEP